LNRRTIAIVTTLSTFALLTDSFFTRRPPDSHGVEGSSYFTITDPPALQRAPAGDAAPYCTNMYHAVCDRRGETRDPTGVVAPDIEGELEALKLYQGIIHDHPDWSSEQVDEELAQQIYTPHRRARIQSAFKWVRREIVRYIEKQPDGVFNRREKNQLEKKLAKTELQLPPPATIYSDEPDLLTKNDIFYERTFDGGQRLRFGGAYFFSNKSWYNIVFTLGHELAHSIDPCEVRSERLSFPAYDRLTACFMTEGLVSMKKTRDECGENDQLSETFADWMAVQITYEALAQLSTEFRGPQLLNATTNAVRDLCEQESDADEELDTEFHPAPPIRIQRIFGDNPSIRGLLHCGDADTNVPQYCDFNYSGNWNQK
jgi:hypothetical protein